MHISILAAKDRFGKFRDSGFRDHQAEIIEFAHESQKRFTVIEAPTGIGKTLAGMCIGGLSGNAIYTVHSKTLQKTVFEDYPEVPMLWGRGNYKCLYDGRLMADACPLSKDRCESYSDCPYNVAKGVAIRSNLCTLNYHYLLTEMNFVGRFSGRKLIIIDEADSLETILADFVGINISGRMIKDYKIQSPAYKTTSSPKSIESWKEWACGLGESLRRHVTRIKMSVDTTGDILTTEQFEAIKQVKQIEGNISKLKMFLDNVDDTWLYEERDSRYGKSIHFNPTWVSQDMAEKYLWSHADRFVLMSATFPYLPVLTKLLGMDMSDVVYKQYPSVFPVKNRQVKYDIAGDLVYAKMSDEIPKIIDRVKSIICMPDHITEKGLIHAVSYKLAKEIMGIGDPRLITHENGGDRSYVLEAFMNSREPLILVSPSMERGVSLDDSLCRFIIWLKAPYLSMADKLVGARLYGSQIGNIWYKSQMLLSIVQGCGRGVRSDTDYCTTYLLDDQIRKAIAKNPGMVPGWFREALW